MWGMVRCAALEIDSRVLSMVCIDAEDVAIGEKMWSQIWWELVLPYRNGSFLSEEDEDAFTEGEICYRGKSWFVRRFVRAGVD